jgi:hypothetical protein
VQLSPGCSDESVAKQLEASRSRVLQRFSGTGVLAAMTAAAALRSPAVAFPVADLETCAAYPATTISSGTSSVVGSGQDAKVRTAITCLLWPALAASLQLLVGLAAKPSATLARPLHRGPRISIGSLVSCCSYGRLRLRAMRSVGLTDTRLPLAGSLVCRCSDHAWCNANRHPHPPINTAPAAVHQARAAEGENAGVLRDCVLLSRAAPWRTSTGCSRSPPTSCWMASL